MTSRPADWLRQRLPPVLARNFRLKALAVGVALVCWTVVVYASDPPDSRTFNVDVPVQNVPAQFEIDPLPPPLSIRVRGTRDHLDAFRSSSLTVSVAFDRIDHAGTQDVPVSVTNADRDVELDSVPSSIRVTVDTRMSVSVPVTVNFTSGPPAGYHYDQNAITVSPPAVTVYGASKKLQDLHAYVDVGLSGIKTTYEVTPNVFLYRGQSRTDRVSDLDVEPRSVTVEVPVTSFTVPRTTAVFPNVTGSPGAGRVVSGISVTPQFVVLNGPQELLNGLDRVTTDPIRLSAGSGTTVKQVVHVTVPQGVSVDPAEVTVTITITVLPTPTPSAAPTPSPTALPTPTPTPGLPTPSPT